MHFFVFATYTVALLHHSCHVSSFVFPPSGRSSLTSTSSTTPRTTTRLNNFFKNIFEKAFENDGTISKDESVSGQIEGPENEEIEAAQRRASVLTATQEKWRKMNAAVPSLDGKTFDVDFYLVGVPNKDPSNDLYGSQVLISDRDREVGQTLPDKPTVSGIRIRFDENNKCTVESQSPFTKEGTEGEWKISNDGKQVRFRILVTGYTRTIETKGSIQVSDLKQTQTA